MNALGPHFFARDPRLVARELLGATIVSREAGVETGGIIVETEAYLGSGDPGSHAATRGITPRNAVMYGPPGRLYVYFTYGCHHMLNLVCEPEGIAGAVLVRAFEPSVGIERMVARRGGRGGVEVANGPGKVAAALGIGMADNGTPLDEGRVSVYDAPVIPGSRVAVSGRIGLSAGHDAQYRFYVRDSAHVSRARPGPRRAGRPET